jgi:hypothetical protein
MRRDNRNSLWHRPRISRARRKIDANGTYRISMSPVHLGAFAQQAIGGSKPPNKCSVACGAFPLP